MHSKIFTILVLLTLLFFIFTGCNSHVSVTPQWISVGGTGLIVISKDQIPFPLTSDLKVEVLPNFDHAIKLTQDAIELFPTEDLQIGDEIRIKIISQSEEFVLRAEIRKPCLTYINDMATTPEIWQLCGQDSSEITQTSGEIVDYAVSKNGDWIVYAAENDDGGTDIWRMGRDGENKEFVYSCGEMVCEQLGINSKGSMIAYRSGGLGGALLLAIEDGSVILIEKGNISNADFSPNDMWLRYFERTKGIIRVLNLDEMKLYKTIESDSDFIGSWKKDGSGFLYGQYNYSGGIAGMDLLELDLSENSESLIFEGTESSYFIYQPTYINNEDLLVLVRMGFNGNRKQIWEIYRNGGEKKKEVTNDFLYNHSLISWNPVEQKLSFQRFNPSISDALPEVWIWEKNENVFEMVSNNAAHPEWVY